MTEKEKSILENFSTLIPLLSESQKDYMLGYGDGMVAAKLRSGETEKAAAQTA